MIRKADTTEISGILSKCALFAGITLKDIAIMVPRLNPAVVTYKKFEFATHGNTPAKQLGIITKGDFFGVRKDNENSGHIMRIYYEGELLGLEAYFSTAAIWHRSYKCRNEGELLWFSLEPVLNAANDEQELKLNLKLRNNIVRRLADSGAEKFFRADMLSVSPLKSRILLYLNYLSEQLSSNTFYIRMNRTQLASYLAVDRSTLSRQLSRMQDDGDIILHGDNGFTICKKETT